MHEQAICSNIINLALKVKNDYQSYKVTKIIINAGILSCINKDSVLLFFNEMKKETPIKEAELVINSTQGNYECMSCGKIFSFSAFPRNCSFCKSEEIFLKCGNEIIIESIEIDDE